MCYEYYTFAIQLPPIPLNIPLNSYFYKKKTPYKQGVNKGRNKFKNEFNLKFLSKLL